MAVNVGELYVDIGVRGLAEATRGLSRMGEQMRVTGRAGGILSGVLGGLGRAATASVAAATHALSSLARAAATGTAALSGMAVAGVYALSQLGKSETAGASLRAVTAAIDQMTSHIHDIALEFGEMVARVFDVAGGVQHLGQTLRAWWEEWRPTVLAAMDLAKMAWDTVWSTASAAIDGIDRGLAHLFSALGVQLRDSDQTWADTVRGWLESVMFFFENWRLYVEYAWESFRLFVANSWERIKAFGQNVVVLLQWVWDNWRDIFTTIGDYISTVFNNAIENMRRLWGALTDYISGRGFHADLRPLTEGFKSSIREMPQFVQANVRDATDRMLAIADELASRREAFAKSREERAKAMLANLRQPAAEQAPRRDQRYGFMGFSDLARQQQESRLQVLAERQAKAAEQAAAGIMGLADMAKGGGIRVQQVGGATFG